MSMQAALDLPPAGLSTDEPASPPEIQASSTPNPGTSTDELPFGLVPYAEGEFDKMHAAGSMLCSASGVPALFNTIPQRYGKLAYARHVSGVEALPDIGDELPIRLGHILEPFIATLLSEMLDVELHKIDAYSMHEFLPLFATPDYWCVIDGELYIIEIKSVGSKVFYRDWREAVPLHVSLQHQCQFATTGAARGIVAVFDRNYCQLETYDTTPVPEAIERIEFGVDGFMANLGNGIFPPPDEDCEADFEIFRRLCYQHEEEKKVLIHGEQALLRASQFQQAVDDKAAAEKVIAAQKRWFQGRMKTAEICTLDDGGFFQWRTNKTKGKDQQRPSRVFKYKEMRSSNDG